MGNCRIPPRYLTSMRSGDLGYLEERYRPRRPLPASAVRRAIVPAALAWPVIVALIQKSQFN